MDIYFLIGALAAVIIARRFSRLIGGIVGMLIAVAVGAWGFSSFAKGGGIAFAGFPVTREVFLAVVAGWFLFEGWGFWQALKARKQSAD